MDYVILRAGNKNRIKWRMKRGKKTKTSRRLQINPRLETTGVMHQLRKISAEFPWNWWSLTHKDEELGSVAYHTPYADSKSCMCINHRFSELGMLHLYLCDGRKCNLFDNHVDKICTSIETNGNLYIYSESKTESKHDIYHHIWKISSYTNNSSPVL